VNKNIYKINYHPTLMKLKLIVREELDKLKIPNTKITVIKHSEVYPDCNEEIDSYLIQISIDSNLDNPFHDCSCSYLDFWYNKDKQRIEHINFSLKEKLKRKGFGRGLVKTMEEIGKKLCCSTSRVCLNTNPSFWNHMGYKRGQDYFEKQI